MAVEVRAQGDTVKTLPGIEITTSVDSATVTIGDLITYTISIIYDSTYELVPPPLGANLGAFDVKDYSPDNRSTLKDGRLKNETIFKLSTFTTGDYVIPPVPITFVLKDRSRKVLLAEPVPITVKSVLLDTSDSADIKPLKPQYEFERNIRKYVYWGIAVLGLLLAYFGIWWWLRKRRVLGDQVDRRTPWEIAFAELAQLEQKNYLTGSKFKEYYFELTEIGRKYLGEMFGADVLEMTTEEFLDHFMSVELPGGVLDECSGLLRHADLVKFAKLTPELERCRADFEIVHSLLEKVRRFIEEKRAAEIAFSNTPPAPTAATGGNRG
jgi:hypothetical protein